MLPQVFIRLLRLILLPAFLLSVMSASFAQFDSDEFDDSFEEEPSTGLDGFEEEPAGLEEFENESGSGIIDSSAPTSAERARSYQLDDLILPPKWSFEIKTGEFEPALERWEEFYGDDTTNTLGLSLGYKFFRQWEAGIAIDAIRDRGRGFLPLNDMLGGNVSYRLYPAHLYLLYRGIFHEDQRFVPYLGGGVTRAYYKQEVENQASNRGDTDGSHWRAGLQISLDWIDAGGAAGIQDDAGVDNTYLTIEFQHFEADVEGIELGGDSVTLGFLFEF